MPTQEEIKSHFENARAIKCLNLNAVVDVQSVKDIIWNEVKKGYFAKNGIICFWLEKVGYAEIVKFKK